MLLNSTEAVVNEAPLSNSSQDEKWKSHHEHRSSQGCCSDCFVSQITRGFNMVPPTPYVSPSLITTISHH